MAERGVAPARLARKQPSGTPRVTVRPNYVGPPFSGLDAAGRARRKPRDRAGEEFAVRVAEVRPRGPKSPRGATSGARPDEFPDALAARRGLETGRRSALRPSDFPREWE